MTLAYTVSGLLVGLLVGLTGVGGGSLMTPLLTLMFGFSPAEKATSDERRETRVRERIRMV